MNPEIQRTARQIITLYEQQRAYLVSKPTSFVEDLHHECKELQFAESFSERTAAEINRAAAEMVLEARQEERRRAQAGETTPERGAHRDAATAAQ